MDEGNGNSRPPSIDEAREPALPVVGTIATRTEARRPVIPRRAFATLALLLTLAVVALLWSVHAGDRRHLRADLASQARQALAGFDLLVDTTLDHNVELADLLARDPAVRDVVARAAQEIRRAPDDREALDRHRREIRTHLLPAWETLHRSQGVRDLHVHLGMPARALVSAQAPRSPDDGVLPSRNLPTDVIIEGRPRAGFETGLGTAGLRGVAPIRPLGPGDTPAVGALEVVGAFDPLLARARAGLGTDFAVLLRAETAPASAGDAASPPPRLLVDGTAWRVATTTSPSIAALPLDGCDCLGDAMPRILRLDRGRVWLASRPLLDAPGAEPVGWVVAWDGIDAEWRQLQLRLRETAVGGGVMLFVAWMAAAAGLQLGARQLHAIIDDATSAVRSSNRDLARKAETDALTGLPNRHAAERRLDVHAGRASDQHAPTSCLLLDLDRFKRVNDRFGHAAGDRALVAAATAIRRAIRADDAAFRWGGEEFLILLREPRDAAAEVAERVRRAVAAAHRDVDTAMVPLTTSIGVAERRPGEPVHAWLRRADKALYRAKAKGRDRVLLAPK